MTLFSRKLSLCLSKIPSSALYILFVNGTSIRYQIPKHHFRAYSSSYFGYCLANPCEQAVSLGTLNRIDVHLKFLSTVSGTTLVQALDPAKLALEIQNSLDENRLHDTWNFYEQHIIMYGFPRKSIVNQILASFAESFDVQWVERAFGLVQQVCEEGKQTLLEKETLIYLSYALAKSGLPAPSATVLRKLVELEKFPPIAAWSAILAYMSQTASGAFVATELILEIGYLFQNNRMDPRKENNALLLAMKPNSTAYNIALAGCLSFGLTQKAEQVLDMMPRIGITVDSNSLIVMAHIYGRNGRGIELGELERHINRAYNLNQFQFQQFQNCLFEYHLKLADLNSASSMVLEMLRKARTARSSLATASLMVDGVVNKKPSSVLCSGSILNHEEPHTTETTGSAGKTIVSYEEYLNDKKFIKLETEAKEMLVTMLAKLHTQVEILTTKRGVIQPTEKNLVKLVKAFLEAGKTKELGAFLIKAEREKTFITVHVINSCISLGWLDQAHELLNQIRTAGIKTTGSVYSPLLRAYCKAKRAGEASSLMRDARREGIQLEPSCYQALIESKILQRETREALHLFKDTKDAKIPRTGHQDFEKLVKGCSEGNEAKLMAKLLKEIKDGQRVDSGVHDWNSVIHFFSRKTQMKEAEKALKKMLSLGHTPNAHTFHSMVTGYAAIGGKYREVTELWSEMKSLALSASVKFDEELLDSVLYTFVRGGFFSKANEVVEMLEKGEMFVDKVKFKTLYVKYHKKLYKGKPSKNQTESQRKRREAALAFKQWVGLD